MDSGNSPMSFFSLFFNDELLEDITFQMNVHNTASANDKGTKPAPPVEVNELKKIFGVILFMGIEKFPSRRLYWKSSTLSKFIADAKISRNRFEEILSILHFNDKNLQKHVGDPNYKSLFKLKPIVDHLQNTFRTILIPETMVTVDEIMVAFKGRHKLQCYMPLSGNVNYDRWLVYQNISTTLKL